MTGSVTYGSLLRQGIRMLTQAGIDQAPQDAWQLLSFVSGLDRTHYFLREGETVPPALQEEYQSLLSRRARHVPLQHLTGTADFYGYAFSVSPDVLIPRQDTEILVEEAERLAAQLYDRRKQETANPKEVRLQIADICTGSGCIATALKKALDQRHIPACMTATDLSEAALAVAEQNALRLEADVTFARGDLLEAVDEGKRFDLILSNPPYIASREIEALMPEVRDHDPYLALDGGADGLTLYRRLIPQAAARLKEGGALLVEIGAEQAAAVTAFMMQEAFVDVRVLRDLAGLDRVVTGSLRHGRKTLISWTERRTEIKGSTPDSDRFAIPEEENYV